VAFYCSHGEQPADRPLGAIAKVRSVGSRRERGRQKIQIKASFFFLPRCMFGGKKKDEQCRSKRHRSALFFF
jgi:hypothetical protein